MQEYGISETIMENFKDFIWTLLFFVWLFMQYDKYELKDIWPIMLLAIICLSIHLYSIIKRKKPTKPKIYLSDNNNAALLIALTAIGLFGFTSECLFVMVVIAVGVGFDVYNRYVKENNKSDKE